MKLLSSVCLIVMVTTALFATPGKSLLNAAKSPPLVLRGSAEVVEIREENTASRLATTIVYLRLKLSLINIGLVPIITLQREPDCSSVVVAKNAEDFDLRDDRYLTESSRGSSELTSPAWEKLRANLNLSFPPSNETRFLYPGQSFDFDKIVRIDLAKDPAAYAAFTANRTESLERLKQLSPVLLQVRCEIWPDNLEGINIDDRRAQKFGHQLQNRWKDVGLLWLDEILSEPITLNLKNTPKQ